MRKVILFSLILLIGQLNAQFSTNWVQSAANGNMPAWFSTGNTERGLGYSSIDNKVYVVSRTGGLFLKKLDAVTGAFEADLDLTGVSGGVFALNDVEAADDGKIYAGNLVTSNTTPFKIYKWSNASATPTVAFSYQADVAGSRFGDNIYFFGKNSDNTAKFMLVDPTRSKVFIIKTTDHGETFVMQDSVQLPANSFGGHASACPVINYQGDIDAIITNSSGKNVMAYNMSGQLIGAVPGGVIATGSTTIRYIQSDNNGYIVTYQYGGGNENIRVVSLNENPANARTYAISTSLGANTNTNGAGDFSYKVRPDGKIDFYILGCNQGLGSFTLDFPFIINGRFNENYTYVGWSQNNNAGFGPDISVRRLAYAYDSNYVYIAVDTKLDRSNANGTVVFLNFDNITGISAGQALGGIAGGGHLFGDMTNPNWKMGFEVDMAFVINPGGNDSVAYLDAAKYFNGNKQAQFIGSSRNSGSAAEGPSVDGIFATNSIRFALDSAYDTRRGLEIRIPKTELNNLGFSGNIQMAAFVVSNTAYFSDVSIPGNITGGNPGFNADFSTMAGGPYFTPMFPLPVELVSFNAVRDGKSVLLDWVTSTEVNNKGFSVERSVDGDNFVEIGFVAGKGTSTLMNQYSFTDANVDFPVTYYRIKQIDLDGSFQYSEVVKVENTSIPAVFSLNQNYPNPFNPSTTISFTVDREAVATLNIYSISGELVTTLFNETAKPGQLYNLQFNAVNLPSGIYFYRLTQGNSVITKKLTLLK